MGPRVSNDSLTTLSTYIETALQLARVPGGALAMVVDGEIIFAKGFGYRNVDAQLPTTADTIYPIASTTKAFTATLVGMLVDDGKLGWDVPVQEYLPSFRLGDSYISSHVTIRDLLTMRTGLPRHDWVWVESDSTNSELIAQMAHLDLSSGFRESFQYNNMTLTIAGIISEVVTGQNWSDLIKVKILDPLLMTNTCFSLPSADQITLSYHQDVERSLIITERLRSTVSAPSGGVMHSTVENMASWLRFNLAGGSANGWQLIRASTLKEIQSPQITTRNERVAPSPQAAYGMGWFVDTYQGRPRVSHGGYLHDVNSDVMLFPEDKVGVVSFTNFGGPRLAKLLNQGAFDALMGLSPLASVEEALARYETDIARVAARNAAVKQVPGTAPSHGLDDYKGVYENRGYGKVEVLQTGSTLIFRRGSLKLPLQHWHYDSWIAQDFGRFPADQPHPFDRAGRLLFETDADGDISALLIQLEPTVAPIRFKKRG
jgi:CubicO group peptidase (beta-lactamase class C family)